MPTWNTSDFQPNSFLTESSSLTELALFWLNFPKICFTSFSCFNPVFAFWISDYMLNLVFKFVLFSNLILHWISLLFIMNIYLCDNFAVVKFSEKFSDIHGWSTVHSCTVLLYSSRVNSFSLLFTLLQCSSTIHSVLVYLYISLFFTVSVLFTVVQIFLYCS